VQVTYTGTATGSATTRPAFRGVVIASYDRTGHLRWVTRMGNAAQDPRTKEYQVASVQLADGVLRVSGTSFAGMRNSLTPFELVFGEGEPAETRVALNECHQFGFIAELDPATGQLIAGSVRINASERAVTSLQLRHNGNDMGQAATDGVFMAGILMFGPPNTYLFNRGRTDELSVTTSTAIVAAFTRYTRQGALSWTRLAGNTTADMTLFSTGISSDDASVFSGNAGERADFEDGTGVTNLAAGATAYLVRYDATGALLWLRGISGRGMFRLLIDDARQAIYALGDGTTDTVFGVGDADRVTFQAPGPFVARFSLATGALTWLRRVDAPSGGFASLALMDDELLASAQFGGPATFQPEQPEAVRVGSGGTWSGNARYNADDGTFLGVTTYVVHTGVRTNDGLAQGVVLDAPR